MKRSLLGSIAREPLFHFVVLGGLLFGASSWVAPRETTSSDAGVIIFDQARLDHLTTLWKSQWKRDPAPKDIAAIVDRYLRQEVFYREALSMGLDRDDEIIRNRLAQKMEAVASDLSTLMRPPTEEQLRAFHADRPDLFTSPPAFAFRQVLYLRSESAGLDLAATLAALRSGGEIPSDRAGKLSVPLDWPLTPAPTLKNAFGGGFAETLSELPVGTWSGPVRSGLGLHFVQLTESRPAQVAPFEGVRDLVARQYEYYSVMDTQAQLFTKLLAKYRVQFSATGLPENVVGKYIRQ